MSFHISLTFLRTVTWKSSICKFVFASKRKRMPINVRIDTSISYSTKKKKPLQTLQTLQTMSCCITTIQYIEHAIICTRFFVIIIICRPNGLVLYVCISLKICVHMNGILCADEIRAEIKLKHDKMKSIRSNEQKRTDKKSLFSIDILSHQILCFILLFFFDAKLSRAVGVHSTFNLGAWLYAILFGSGIGKFIGRSSMAAGIQFDNPLFWIRWSDCCCFT